MNKLISMSVAMRSMHHEMIRFADEALEKFSATERNYSGLTMGISDEDYEQIVQEIDACRKRIAQIALKGRGAGRVYRLNLQLFPLTWEEEKKHA